MHDVEVTDGTVPVRFATPDLHLFQDGAFTKSVNPKDLGWLVFISFSAYDTDLKGTVIKLLNGIVQFSLQNFLTSPVSSARSSICSKIDDVAAVT